MLKSHDTALGSGTTGGTGYGNKSNPEAEVDSSDTRFDKHTNTDPYSGATEYGSGTTSGVGYGNKSAPDGSEVDTSDTRFGTNHSEPYSGATKYGSGSTGGAGFGNKHTNANAGNSGPPDSTMGKLMEKAGGLLKNPGMAEKGAEKREQAKEAAVSN
ncbi:hypothetical protein LTR86_001019 [Recurvomyces mirabilis]|nr:hypothetical protein LTR86_001019 [Recurvomyces mirabilis]